MCGAFTYPGRGDRATYWLSHHPSMMSYYIVTPSAVNMQARLFKIAGKVEDR